MAAVISLPSASLPDARLASRISRHEYATLAQRDESSQLLERKDSHETMRGPRSAAGSTSKGIRRRALLRLRKRPQLPSAHGRRTPWSSHSNEGRRPDVGASIVGLKICDAFCCGRAWRLKWSPRVARRRYRRFVHRRNASMSSKANRSEFETRMCGNLP
jgi:hypothetical protein